MRRFALLLLAAVIGCGPTITKAPPPVLDEWPEIVQSWDGCLDRFHCPNWAPFVHGADPQVGQIWWLVSTSGHACEIPADAPYRLMEPFTCAWRTRRGV